MLIPIFLLTKDVELLCICLLAIHMSFVKDLYNSFIHFYKLSFFLLLIYRSSLYVLDTSSSSDICVVSFIFQSVILYGEILIRIKCNISFFSVVLSCFLCILRNFCLPQSYKDILLFFFQELYGSNVSNMVYDLSQINSVIAMKQVSGSFIFHFLYQAFQHIG